jgi:peptide deformylase
MKFEIILHEQTPAVNPLDNVKSLLENHHEQLKEFVEFARTRSTAVGLAANQVSLDGERFMHRCFAIMNLKDRTWRLIIDPVITEQYGIKIEKSEGCLTWPGKKIISERHRFVKVSYYTVDENFDEITRVENEEHEGFEAQIWQHEINHLNGFVERVEERSFLLHIKEPGRNDKCPCGSGRKYKVCCHSYVNPPIMRAPPTMDDQLAKAGQRLMGTDLGSNSIPITKQSAHIITKQGKV